ncbi:hypothetical protein [Maledivibacter halophilus]|uniref:hypothetical protein n=1 Tax=Maledivibacter halophilus TaxID=36842 RepID=UPI0014824584|nr:hypothetical protein [Maledivibacter halophilus]
MKKRFMYKVACSKSELSCIISNLFQELLPICDNCKNDTIRIKGIVAGTDKVASIEITDYGCNYYGDIAAIENIREKRCLQSCSL